MFIGTALVLAGIWWNDKWLTFSGVVIWGGVLITGDFLYVSHNPWAVGIAGYAVARRLAHIGVPDRIVLSVEAMSLALVTYSALDKYAETMEGS